MFCWVVVDETEPVLEEFPLELEDDPPDDPEEEDVEHRQAGGEQEVEAARVRRDAGGDPAVREVELEGTDRLKDGGEVEVVNDSQDVPSTPAEHLHGAKAKDGEAGTDAKAKKVGA